MQHAPSSIKLIERAGAGYYLRHLLAVKGCLDWDSFATFLRLFSDADAQVRKRRDSFASTQATQLCRVRRVGWPTHSRLLHGGVILRVRL